MKKFIAAFLLIIMIFSQTTQAKEITVPSIYAEAALVMDLNTGQILYEKNINEKLAPASVTKILTALIVLEKCKLEDKVLVGPKPPYEDGSKIYLLDGEELSIKDLLYAMMLESANDAALALAEHISGSKEEFAKLMNARAKELGAINSNFVNPNGLYEEEHYTSAWDLALISIKAMENEVFREIVTTDYYEIKPTNKQPEMRYIYNINKLVRGTKYKYEGVTGIKTGYTTKSKNTIVASASRDNHSLLVIQLRSEQDLYEDTIKLLDYGFNAYNPEQILDKTKPYTTIKIKGTKKTIELFPKENLYASALDGEKVKYTTSIELNTSYKKIKNGNVMGVVEITLDSGQKFKYPLISKGEYKSFFYYLKYKSPELFKRSLKPIFKIILIGMLPALYIRKIAKKSLRKRKQKILMEKRQRSYLE